MENEEAQESIARNTQNMIDKARSGKNALPGGTAKVGRNGRVTVEMRNPSVPSVDKKRR